MMRNFSAKEAEFDERVQKIARTTDEFEGYQTPHAARIAALSDAVAVKFNLASHDRYSLRQAALLHDIGEPVMNRDYVRARRMLREDERVDMQRHTVIGEQETAKRGSSRAVQLLVRWHHEWWNGAGYPDALEREQIPLAARILRVIDTFCAMIDERPYRAALSESEARRYLTEWAGIEFDPQVVKAFLALEIVKQTETGLEEKEAETSLAEKDSEISAENNPEISSERNTEITEHDTEIVETSENSSEPASIFTHS